MLGCKGCTFGELGARGVRLECMGGVRVRAGRASGALERAGVRAGGVWRAGVRAGRRLERGRAPGQASGTRARGCESGRAAARAATGVLFTQEHVLHPESPK
ncbi:hypothetical protein CDL15_Pgr017243 [Punica granatum]|uniref:Uncharacterized protein n=1 Tax=Punica granatum TaxID=22663 RepID=A0A218WQH7_PUNGR|nr:hypothetical protein CDL15_Pgr017243 [Punica granatum]